MSWLVRLRVDELFGEVLSGFSCAKALAPPIEPRLRLVGRFGGKSMPRVPVMWDPHIIGTA